jgi:uncharacterized membrane protein YoaK (UPF0700 family)
MPAHFLRHLTHRQRTRRTNLQLGALLAFVAGAVNAGGFLAVQRYTSHMSGIVSGMADSLVLGEVLEAAGGLCLVLSFVCGAASTSLLVNWGRRRSLHSQYALPLLLEAALLLVFGVLGASLQSMVEVLVPSTALLLCFLMGLQNATITKVSQAEIRTTHMTGVITDLGIELGRLLYWNRSEEANARHRVLANRGKLAVHLTIVGLFFVGGVVGAIAFKHVGYSATVPLAAVLLTLASPPLLRDLRRWQALRGVFRRATADR